VKDRYKIYNRSGYYFTATASLKAAQKRKEVRDRIPANFPCYITEKMEDGSERVIQSECDALRDGVAKADRYLSQFADDPDAAVRNVTTSARGILRAAVRESGEKG
jgi:hypothetical protein